MGLFKKMKEPVFLKESSNAERQIEELRKLEPLLNVEGRTKIKQHIRYLEYGIIGEDNIAFELKNSHMPMYILHDIYLEDGDLSAQIDYMVFTRKICFVIECKNLFGNIEINGSGDFVRTMEFGGKKVKEGIYSPITQNQRHLELMKKIRTDKKGNVFTKFMADKHFYDFNRSIVVLANPKTILNGKYAAKEVKEQVIRADQLISYIKRIYEQSKEMEDSDDKMRSWAESYLKLHKEPAVDYSDRYAGYLIQDRVLQQVQADTEAEAALDENIQADEEAVSKENTLDAGQCLEHSEIYKELRAYRLAKSREENIKPYYIFNDNQLKDLIRKKPASKEELKQVSGFGDIKVNKYGEDILAIVKEQLSDTL